MEWWIAGLLIIGLILSSIVLVEVVKIWMRKHYLF